MKTKIENINGYTGIYKILNYDVGTKKWIEPQRGKRFRAARWIDGKKVIKRFKTFLEAKSFRSESSINIQPPIMIVPDSTNQMTFGDLVKIWDQNWLQHKEHTTRTRYRSLVKHFQFFWNMPVEKIQPNDIDHWISEIKKPEYLANCLKTRCCYDHEYSVLRGIFGYYASRFNRNYRLPFLSDHAKMLKVREKPKVEKDLTLDELQRFFEALRVDVWDTKWEPIYFLAQMQYAIYSRIQEPSALHYEDFDFERNKLSVNKKIQWVRSKSEKAAGLVDRVTDGAKANGGKILEMPAFAAKVFREWTIRSGIRSGLLFKCSGKIIPYHRIRYRYNQALKKAGLPFTATHLLRHASLSEHYDTNKDILATAKVAGHSDLRSTERYTKVRNERVIECQQKMDEKLMSIFNSKATTSL